MDNIENKLTKFREQKLKSGSVQSIRALHTFNYILDNKSLLERNPEWVDDIFNFIKNNRNNNEVKKLEDKLNKFIFRNIKNH
jgi:hypothetical protein